MNQWIRPNNKRLSHGKSRTGHKEAGEKMQESGKAEKKG
jgi:hypothetical protein